MTQQCELTGVKISFGNNVSHAHNKTKRNFTPNLQKKSIYSDILNQMVRLKISTKAIKSIECAGGFDKYIISIPNNKLSIKALKLKKAIKIKIAKSPKNEKNDVINLVTNAMENAMKFKVPLKVDYSFGQNWYEAH